MSIELVELTHQTNALRAIQHVFNNVKLNTNNPIEQNPTFDKNDLHIKNNIQTIWDGGISGVPAIPRELRKSDNKEDSFGFDIRMETGTGKTYVYTHMMYLLNELYGFNKFVILVPSAPIKEGTKNFIEADYSKRYFNDLFPNVNIELNVLNAQKNSKGKKMFPSAIADYARGSRLEKNKIQVLLTTSSMLTSKATMEKDDYDQTIFGNLTQPYEVIRNTKPIVIIDEPHRFKKTNKSYKAIEEELQPQAVIRFGATFPNEKGNKEKDYNNLIYNLGSAESFNKGLVKGVSVQTLGEVSHETEKIKLTTINKGGKSVNFRDESSGKVVTLNKDDDLSIINDEFAGLKIEKILKGAGTIELSNGLTLSSKDSLYADIFSRSYQELMLKQAIHNHIKIEERHFMRQEKVKVLSLFFIDNIYAYRGDNGSDGYIRLRFEKMLKEAFLEKLNEYENKSHLTNREKEYMDFLTTSVENISLTNGGYFSEDNSTNDKAIEDEVEQILRDKDSLLNFKDEQDNWNIRRFIFSKWTLKEGWDNPNVFQIAKLRTSGSEISKLQEVGRGLRLPVDENGNRLDDEQFYLTYLIDFSEQDFAEKLIAEINSETKSLTDISALLPKVAELYNKTENELFAELLIKEYVDTDKQIKKENKEVFFKEYPEFKQGVQSDKIVDESKNERATVKIRKDNFNKIRKLWNKVNQKYYLSIEKINNEMLADSFYDIITNTEEPVYGSSLIHVKQRDIISKNNEVVYEESIVHSYEANEEMTYKEFLVRLQKNTGISIEILHSSFIKLNKEDKLPDNYFNTTTLTNIQILFKEWFEEKFVSHYSYERLNIDRQETKLTDINGDVVDFITQGNIGVHRAENVEVPDTFLYDAVVYDSPKERETIENSNSHVLKDKIVVFGKIPRRSIQIPLYFGGTTSPDFIYVLQKANGDIKLGLIIETKDINDKSQVRGSEKHNIESARKFFDAMADDDIEVIFKPQLNKDDIVNIINDIV